MQLQQRVAEEMQRQQTFDESRKQDVQRIHNVTMSLLVWMSEQLNATKEDLETGDALVLDVNVYTEGVSNFRPTQFDTGKNTLLEERGRAVISIRLPNDEHRILHSLQLLVCAEVQYTLGLNIAAIWANPETQQWQSYLYSLNAANTCRRTLTRRQDTSTASRSNMECRTPCRST
jgi:hypothetical protein